MSLSLSEDTISVVLALLSLINDTYPSLHIFIFSYGAYCTKQIDSSVLSPTQEGPHQPSTTQKGYHKTSLEEHR